MVYLDNNATTMMSTSALEALVHWSNRGNPSAGYSAATAAQEMLARFRAELAAASGLDLTRWELIFTSGASEANATIITGTVTAARRTGRACRIITSAFEHKSVALACEAAEADGAEVVRMSRADDAELREVLVAARARPALTLVTVMAANNETGALFDIAGLSRVAREFRVPFHTDAVQAFGKGVFASASAPMFHGAHCDAFTVSFHKLHGPLGVGLLAVRRDLAAALPLPALVHGTQASGRRGGTENVPALAAARVGFLETLAGRVNKTARLTRLRSWLIQELESRYDCYTLAEYLAARGPDLGDGAARLVWLSPAACLPNTLALAIVQLKDGGRRSFCNRACRDGLEARGVVVGLGSACNAASAGSDVLEAMGVPPKLRRGVLRISLGDATVESDLTQFLWALGEVLRSGEVCV